jgi:hydroxymethylglutaryl-CoA lyase
MIKIFEVGPRDGLQNEAKSWTIDQKLDLIEALLKTGIDQIEVGAFVRPDRVPQMAGTDEIFRHPRFHQLSHQYPLARFWALVPNEKGLERAISAGAKCIAVFGGATETFVQKNIGMSISESLETFGKVVRKALDADLQVRGYISVCWWCPYEGQVTPEAVIRVVKPMLDMGIPELSLGDTIGKAHPLATERLLLELFKFTSPESFAVHFHDTYGMAVANIDRSTLLGISCVDSSIGGLGGCPYAPGAAGNVATEDVYSLFEGYHQFKIEAEILDIAQMMKAATYAQTVVGRPLPSKRLAAYLSTRR